MPTTKDINAALDTLAAEFRAAGAEVEVLHIAMDAYHTTTEHGERVIVVCPGGETDPLHPDYAEAWAREILRAVNRARDVGDQEPPPRRYMAPPTATRDPSKPPVRSKKTGRAYCQWPEQRAALAELGVTAGKLKLWLQCAYLRARDLRGGARPLTGRDLAIIEAEAPVTFALLVPRLLRDEEAER